MARYLILLVALAFQIGALNEEAHRGVRCGQKGKVAVADAQIAVLSGQIARGDRLPALHRDSCQGESLLN